MCFSPFTLHITCVHEVNSEERKYLMFQCIAVTTLFLHRGKETWVAIFAYKAIRNKARSRAVS